MLKRNKLGNFFAEAWIYELSDDAAERIINGSCVTLCVGFAVLPADLRTVSIQDLEIITGRLPTVYRGRCLASTMPDSFAIDQDKARLVTPAAKHSRVNYGIDAPTIIIRWGTIGLVSLIGGVISSILLPSGEWYTLAVPIIFYSLAGSLLCPTISILMGSLFFKFMDRDWLLRHLSLQGHEKVLDVGCGHGLLLIGAAKRLDKGGLSYGLDLWSQDDQASNSHAATMENARLEGVADRVRIQEGDMRSMPFEDDMFHCVVSSWAIHNIYDSAGRAKALDEILRVLKPGGTIAILDIDHGTEYANYLRQKEGLVENVRQLGPHLTFGNFTYLILATKR